MPGIIPGSGVAGMQDTEEHVAFSNAVAGATGLDPRVVYAWAQLETGGHPYGGYHNWLNLRPYPGDPYSGVSSGNFEEYSSVENAEAATIRRLKQPFAAGILKTGGTTPANEISGIAASGWDAGHYGGAGGPNLLAEFRSLYPNVNAGSAALKKGSTVNAVTGGQQSPGSLESGVKGAAGGVLDPVVDFLKEWAIRGALIIVGTGIALVGLYLIARSFGAPSIGVADKATTLVTRGAVKPKPKPRRQLGDAAIARGEPVTRTSRPEPLDRASKRHAAGMERGRQRAARERAAARDRAFGGDDDIPY